MAEFKGNPGLTLEQNLKDLSKFSRVGDVYINCTERYLRIDARKNNGDAWVLIK